MDIEIRLIYYETWQIATQAAVADFTIPVIRVEASGKYNFIRDSFPFQSRTNIVNDTSS